MATNPFGDYEADETATPMAEINVTPMVDVMLVLLIIFMVAAPLMMAGVPLQLPKTAAPRLARPQQPIILSLDRNGHAFLGQDPVADDALPGRLHELAQAAPAQVIYVRADRGLPYGQVMQMMGEVAAAGFSRVSLLAEQAPAPPTQ
jgi:biopolymer transport protein TolR